MDSLPIASAPKDGTSVLAFDPLDQGRSPRMLTMRWDRVRHTWCSDVHSFVPFDPTHWMPIPEPPK